MAFGNSTFTDVGGAVSDLLSSQSTAEGLRLKAQGDQVEATNYDLSAGLAMENATFTESSTNVKSAMADRQIYQGLGEESADIAASGFENSGSALDLLRSSASEGALQKALISQQGQITEAGFQEQATAYTNLAGYANQAAATENDMASKAETNGMITGGIKAAAAVATLFTA